MAGSTSKTIVIAGVVIGLLAGCAGGLYLYGGAKLFQSQTEQGSSAIAKAKLTAAAVAVDMYASQNGTFSGLNAQAMMAIDPSHQWVDGDPQVGQIGISDCSDTSFVISVKENDGVFYMATKERGKLTITDANGNQI